MSQTFLNSYFYLLPNEVLIKILSSIDTFSVLNFCDVYDCDYFLQDRNVTKTINLYKKYALENLDVLSKKINFNHVTTLNVNCLYWIQAAKLRKFVTRLVNLETLYAIQTNLSLTHSDTDAFSKSKIKKLGISVNRNDEIGPHKVPTVETLYINVIKATTLISPAALDSTFPQLRSLWIDVEEPCGKEIILHCINARTKIKIFCQVNAPVPPLNFDHYNLTTYYNNRRGSQPYVMCCEKFGAKFDLEASSGESWNVLEELHCCKPYGPRDARRLYTKEDTLDDIFFEELNFHHSWPVCNDRCREAVKQILKSPNARCVKKLCVMMCLLLNKYSRESVAVRDEITFTRKRIGIESSTASHPVEEVFKNFAGLQHLEIYTCHQTSHHSAIQGYPFITIFENLKSLTLEIPITLDGSFLPEVLNKCKCLETLKITALSQHEKLNFNICNAIPDAISLKDFRYENHRIPLDKLLKCLSLIKSGKLERLVLICNEIDKFSAGPLTEFLELNPQLIFLYFLIRGSTETSLRMAQQTLNLYKKKHPSKVFLVKKIDVFNRICFPIPDVHFCEMIKTDNSVASLCVFEDFTSF